MCLENAVLPALLSRRAIKQKPGLAVCPGGFSCLMRLYWSGAALAGIETAGNRYIIVCSCPFFFAAGSADLVIGSRRIGPDGYRNYPFLRLLASRCFGLLVRLLSGLDYDTQCGIKGYRRQAARTIYSKCTIDGFSFDFEVLMRADKLGLRVEQLPVSVVNFRESKINIIQDSFRMFRDLFRIRRAIRKEDS